MSRLRRLKKLRRKNRIKATACGLALALVIGSAQGLGTYALFTDVEDASSNLAISTGDVDVEVSKGHNFTDVQPGSSNPYIYTITNNGTLRQQIKLSIDIPTTVDDSTLDSALSYLKSEISYSVDFGLKQSTEEDSEQIPILDNEVGKYVDKIESIKLSEEKILQDNGTIFILEPGQQITANATINIPNIDDKSIQESLNNIGNIELYLNVEARQISDNINQFTNYGFYDIESQKNIINISKVNIVPSEAVIIDQLGSGALNKTQRVRIYERYIGISDRAKDFKLEEATGLFTGCKISEKQDTITIEDSRIYDGENYLFGDIEGKDNVTIGYTEDNISKQVKFDFLQNYDIHGNKRVIVKYTITTINNSKTIVEKNGLIIATELEESTKLEVVEPPKDEVEESTEPGVIEPPKDEVEEQIEQEVVEQPKEEITEIPKQPEAIEQPKENEGIQE